MTFTKGAPSVDAAPAVTCYHCGDPVDRGTQWQAVIDGATRRLCCAGCEAVARTIVEAGLEDYYRTRSAFPRSQREHVPEALALRDGLSRAAVERHYVADLAPDCRGAELLLTGIECAACAWLIERDLSSRTGIRDISVNYATHRVQLQWDPTLIDLGRIVAAVQALGYGAVPFDPEVGADAAAAERRSRLRRLGVAGLFGMQIMMISVALYSGHWWGMDSDFQQLFRWLSACLCIPIIAYAANPFFVAAWRGVRNAAPGMDLPVSLGIGLAFLASVIATLNGTGEVWFDSVAMFTFALLTARYLEFVARQRTQHALDALLVPAPALARRLDEAGGIETIAAAELEPGDRVSVLAGESVPADGVLTSASAQVDEALLSGESRPVSKGVGDTLVGGSINIDSPLELRVTHAGAQSTLARIVSLVERAAAARAPLVQLTDRIAGYFVIAVLATSAAVAFGWLLIDPTNWIAPTIAVLVATCPCALSLATPSALTVATRRLAQSGLLATDGLRIDALARVDRVILDKTGTLTEGGMRLHELRPLAHRSPTQCLRIAAACEQHGTHPIASAVRAEWARPVPVAEALEVHPHRGISADLDGQRHILGAPDWVLEHVASGHDAARASVREMEESGASVVLLATPSEVLCAMSFLDALRRDAGDVIAALRARGIAITMLSGDRTAAVSSVARKLGIDDAHANLRPDDKLARLRSMRARGETLMAIGDGVNDAPLLAAADVSVAMSRGALLARASADFLLSGERLGGLHDALDIAQQTLRVIRQNVAWALGYNLLVLPAAALGVLPPWAAALGMSASSLLVLGNSLRSRTLRAGTRR